MAGHGDAFCLGSPETPWLRLPRVSAGDQEAGELDLLWNLLDDLMEGALARFQHTLDVRDAAEWSCQRDSFK